MLYMAGATELREGAWHDRSGCLDRCACRALLDRTDDASSRKFAAVDVPFCFSHYSFAQRGDAVPIIKSRSRTLFADSTHCTAESDIIRDKELDEVLAEDKQLYNLIVVSGLYFSEQLASKPSHPTVCLLLGGACFCDVQRDKDRHTVVVASFYLGQHDAETVYYAMSHIVDWLKATHHFDWAPKVVRRRFGLGSWLGDHQWVLASLSLLGPLGVSWLCV